VDTRTGQVHFASESVISRNSINSQFFDPPIENYMSDNQRKLEISNRFYQNKQSKEKTQSSMGSSLAEFDQDGNENNYNRLCFQQNKRLLESHSSSGSSLEPSPSHFRVDFSRKK